MNLVKQKVNESGDVENISSGKAVYDRNYNKLQTFSIIVSGWPAVGKTTVAAELADDARADAGVPDAQVTSEHEAEGVAAP